MSTPAQPNVNQTGQITGDGNTQFIAVGDIIVQPPAHDPAPPPTPKPRTLNRWLGVVAIGGLALGGATPLVVSIVHPRPAIVHATPAGAPIRVASSPRISAPNHLAAALNVSANTPPRTPRPESVTQVRFDPPAAIPVVQEPGQWPNGKSALCNDGSFSPSLSRPGTCAGHAGVAVWRYPKDHPYWRSNNRAA
ncbi:MAG TPA: DUF3761 domain-containing protein [Longimicrobium sp.]|nr:DUF3761 domain-containing protein [Longimicrobium sp.]